MSNKILEFIPNSLKLNVKYEYEIYKTNPADLLNDHTYFQANIIVVSLIHINSRHKNSQPQL